MDKHNPVILFRYIRREYIFDEIKKSGTFTRIIHSKDFVKNSVEKTIEEYFSRKDYNAEYFPGNSSTLKQTEQYEPSHWRIEKFAAWGALSVFCAVVDVKFPVFLKNKIRG